MQPRSTSLPSTTRAAAEPAGAAPSRWLVGACAAGTACFVGCFGVAIARYPGGTWFDPQAPGHSFTRNFLCDLMQTRALNGADAAVGSAVARVGMVAMLAALGAFFALVAALESPTTRAGRLARGAGLLAAVLGCAVPLAPSDRYRTAHVLAVVGSFAPALVAGVAALVVCLRARGASRWIRAAALVTLGAGAFDGLAYAYAYAVVYSDPSAQMPVVYALLPGLQRVATLGMVGWVAAVCAHFARARRAS